MICAIGSTLNVSCRPFTVKRTRPSLVKLLHLPRAKRVRVFSDFRAEMRLIGPFSRLPSKDDLECFCLACSGKRVVSSFELVESEVVRDKSEERRVGKECVSR